MGYVLDYKSLIKTKDRPLKLQMKLAQVRAKLAFKDVLSACDNGKYSQDGCQSHSEVCSMCLTHVPGRLLKYTKLAAKRRLISLEYQSLSDVRGANRPAELAQTVNKL